MKKDKVNQEVEYWRCGAQEDMSAGKLLLKAGKSRHAYFFLHLALEKMLKAHVCRALSTTPPHIHSLLLLAEIARLPISSEMRGLLAELNRFNIAGRYPAEHLPLPKGREAQRTLCQIEEVYQWLTVTLSQ